MMERLLHRARRGLHRARAPENGVAVGSIVDLRRDLAPETAAGPTTTAQAIGRDGAIKRRLPVFSPPSQININFPTPPLGEQKLRWLQGLPDVEARSARSKLAAPFEGRSAQTGRR
jgi:hypothetical protein